MEPEARPAEKRRRNWWKPAFFVSLLAFEFTREVAVIEASEGAVPSGSDMVIGGNGYASVRGRWYRTDGGGPLVPSVVSIECRQQTRLCIEATVTVMDDYVSIPEIDWFEAEFTPDAVTYENDLPECARYFVRIDLRMRRTFGVRERKNNRSNPNCRNLEPRIEMQVGDAYESRDPLEGHFVPLMRLLGAVL